MQLRETAVKLANGCCVATYMRLRSVTMFNPEVMHKFMKRPTVFPDDFKVPAPFAFAIQQLGMYHVSSLPKELILCPSMNEDSASRFGLPSGEIWSAMAYLAAIEYAASLGMQFSAVEPSPKIGSSWSLYKPVEEDDRFDLRRVLPEDNYTEESAVVLCLWCVNAAAGFFSEIVDLSAFTNDYGCMIRNPHPGVNVMCA